MMTNCVQINLILELAAAEKNEVSESAEGWSKIDKVIYMKNTLSITLKNKIEQQVSNVRYRKFDGSSHYPADEGYICDEHSVAISFPLKK